MQNDTEMAIIRKQQAQKEQTAHLRSFFEQVDSSGNGLLSLDEFLAAFEDPVVKTWAGIMSIDTRDLKKTFYILDGGDGLVSVEEFLAGVPNMAGNAKSGD